jgi:heme oxygenase
LIDQPSIETADASADAQRGPRACDSLRQTLRTATAAPHARLHLHPGFAAIQNGTIARVDYRSLLARLYGLLGPGARGRHFFLGRGADTSAAWHLFLERLASLLTSTPCVAEETVAAAVASFAIFEAWMRDWKSGTE